MSIPTMLIRWREGMIALVAAAALGACSKGQAGSEGSTSAAPASQPSAGGASAQPVDKPHGSHDPAHGGLVLMDAHHHHVELALDAKSGKHRLYVSDDARAPLPASTFDEVRLSIQRDGASPEVLAMARSADGAYWEAAGQPVPERGAKVALSYTKGGATLNQLELPVEYVLTGKMPDEGPPGGHAAGAHAHKAPHGGLVATTSGGHIELVADAAGRFQVWLLDQNLAPRPAEGATVKIKVATKGYADIVAQAQGDHFEGTGAAVPGAHPAAIVTATVGGKTETARFELHLEAGSATPAGHGAH